ncbi:MAG: flagellin [Methylotenera sp.]|nr:flagellin [Methylotenera sp.]MDD4925854.1 flagellin [Methylotenera sp.]NOS96338.1 flagellin [Methylotenera sp.]
MAAVINTNIASLNTQRNLSSSQSALNTSIQRLSSGLRINSSKDDAAGLAIASRMDSQVRGLNVAIRNSNDGISLAQTAEGALGKVGDMLQRMRELAVQSVNSTNSQSDRDALQSEVTQLKEEITRVSGATKFNGTNLIDGSFTSKNFQVGANSGETITLTSVGDARLASLGSLTNTTYTQTTAAATATAFANSQSLNINGVTIASPAGAADAPAAVIAFKAAFDAAKLLNTNNANVNPGLANVTMSAGGAITSTDATLTLSNLVNVSGVTAGTTNGTPTVTTATGIAALTVANAANAAAAIDGIDAALTSINSSRATLGAVQNRFESVVANLQVAAENTTAAKSRIMDADFAAETANLTRGQILQQAGTAMLAQANSLPNGVLALLRG